MCIAISNVRRAGCFFLTATTPLMNDYVASGKVYLVHHDFPLPMHAHSLDAAKWANAAAEIGKFREVETALYTKQDVHVGRDGEN